MDLGDRARDAGGDRVHHLHHLDDAHDRVGLDPRPDLDEGRRARAPARGRKCRSSATRSCAPSASGLRRSLGRQPAARARPSGTAPPRRTCSCSPSVSIRSSSSSDSSMIRRISRTSSSLRATRLPRARARRTCPSRATSQCRLRRRLALRQRGHRPRLEDDEGFRQLRPRAIAHSTSWWEPKQRSTRRAELHERVERRPVEAGFSRRSRYVDADGAAAAARRAGTRRPSRGRARARAPRVTLLTR